MSNVFYRLPARSSVTLLLVVSFILITAPAAAAFDGPENKVKDSTATARPAEATGQSSNAAPANTAPSNTVTEAPAPARVASPETPAQVEPATASTPTVATLEEAFARAVSAAGSGSAAFPAAALPRVSTAPMSAGEKFNLFLKHSFKPPGAFAQPIASGLFNELLDNNEGKEDTLDDFFADAMTRAARSYAFRVTSGFFEKFALPTILRQDPRYHRSEKSSAGGKIAYAISRVFVTQGDRSGNQPNVSYLAGGLIAAGISNVWVREEHKNVSNTFRRWGIHIGLTALSNILREFLGGQ